MNERRATLAGDGRSSEAWISIASLALLGITLLSAAWRSSDLDGLAFTELPGLVGWLFLAVIASAVLPSGDDESSGLHRPRSDAIVWVPIIAAGCHTVAWWGDVSAIRLAASLLAAASLLGFLISWLPARSRSGPLTIAQLGSMVATVALAGNLVLEMVETLADPSTKPAVLDAWAPGLGVVAVATGMSLVESGLRAQPRSVTGDVAGTFQMLLFGVGWFALVAGAALDDLGLRVTSVALLLLAITVFLVRLAPELSTALAARASARWFALGLLAAAAYLGLLVQVVVGFADGRYADAASFPQWLETAVDLTAFVGLAASGVIGLVSLACVRRGDVRIDIVSFVLFLGGMIGVVAASAADVSPGARLAWVSIAIATVVVASIGSRDIAGDIEPSGPGDAGRPEAEYGHRSG